MNAFLMISIVPTVVGLLPFIQIICQFVNVKLHDQISLPGFRIFPLMLIDAVGNNVIFFTLASKVNVGSNFILKMHARQTIQFTRKSATLAREIRSCSVLKIKFGSNFIDRLTPLIIQNFCITQTLTLLLINEER